VPGPFYFPPVASLITSGGRLLLALAEKAVADAGGTYLFCDTDSLCIVANEKGGFSRGGARADLGYVGGADPREFVPVPCLSHDQVIEISMRFASLISPRTGKILGWIDLSGLMDKSQLADPDAVLNGIAYYAKGDRLFVTGKLWPKLFEIRVVQQGHQPSGTAAEKQCPSPLRFHSE
jgi:hypothetical protein